MRIIPATSNQKRPQSLLDSAGRFFAARLGKRAARWLDGFPKADAPSFLAFEGEVPVGFVSAVPLAAGQQIAFLYLDGAANTAANALLLLEALNDKGDFLLLDPQRLSVPEQEFAPQLTKSGWEAFHRQRLRLNIEGRPSAEPASGELTPRQVEQGDLPALAFLQSTAYHGSDDALVYPHLAHPGLSQQMLEQWLRGYFGKPLRQASLLTTVPGSGVGGFVLSSMIAKKTALIVTLAVSPRHRGQGLARRLMNRAITTCLAEGYSTVELFVSSNNHAALGLYESLGFKHLSEDAVYRRELTQVES